jgi:virulence factor Mce-like protein
VTRRPTNAVTASPLLVGAVTTLVTIVAVFLSYNANAGLPFVPTYPVNVTVPDASGLVRGNDVRTGGKRVGIVSSIEPVKGARGRPVAKLDLKLQIKGVKPIGSDSRVIVRPLSPLGLKYLELTPSHGGRKLPDKGRLTLDRSTPTVELDEVQNAFDVETRRAVQIVTDGLGTGLAGRGADLNELLVKAPPLLTSAEHVARNVSDPRTGLARFFRGADSTVGELDSSRRQLGSLIEGGEITTGALADQRDALGEGIGETPPTEIAGTRALRVARPVLADAETFLREARPGLRVLAPATQELDSALRRGIPVLRRATGLAGRLRVALAAVDRLSRDPNTRLTLIKLRATLVSARPTVNYVAPLQTRCNYLGLWTRNVNSTISEGDDAGTWFRTLPIAQAAENAATAKPAPDLHVNPYGHAAAPGQDGECEAGNEGYLPGQQIGNQPGNQGRSTENTFPPAGVKAP